MNTINRYRVLGLISTATIAMAAVTLGSTVIRMDLATLARSSDLIFEGQVESVSSAWDADRRTIFTTISVRVDDPLKGPRQQTAVVRQWGGKVGALNLAVPGMPEFRSGDRAVLFLKQSHPGVYAVSGMSQGKYDIVDDMAISRVLGLDLVEPGTLQRLNPSSVSRLPLRELKSKIRELVR